MTGGLVEPLTRIARDLTAIGARFAVVGGIAVGFRSEERFTRDIDLAIAVSSDADAEAVVRDLLHRGYAVDTVLEQNTTKRLATVRLQHRDEAHEGSDEIIFDLLFASSGIESVIVDAAPTEEVAADLIVPVASRAHLIAMKLLSYSDRRTKDGQDLIELLSLAEPAELDVCREAIQLIKERGYSRDVDLAARLEEMLAIAQQDDEM